MTKSKGLVLLREELGDCRRCGLAEGRRNIVFGSGDPSSPLMFVGEAPGADEDEQGLPFVGRAGKLLTKMLEAIGWTRDTVYVANMIKCRPPENRRPERAELDACRPFVLDQVAIVRPVVVVALGLTAAHVLTGDVDSMSRLHGRVHPLAARPPGADVLWSGKVKVVPTFHPAFLLRVPSGKPYAWRDMKTVARLLEKEGVVPPRPVVDVMGVPVAREREVRGRT